MNPRKFYVFYFLFFLLPLSSIAQWKGTGNYLYTDYIQVYNDEINGVGTGVGTSSIYIGYRNTLNTIIQANGGNVGIGTTTPSARLEVNGGVFVRNGNLQVRGQADGLHTALKLFNQQGSGDLITSVGLDFHHFEVPDAPNARIYEKESGSTGTYGGSLIFSTRTSGGLVSTTELIDRMVIDHTGKVGIGTSNLNDFMLSVNGRIRATEVKVYTGWADFVFAPEYRLRPLSEVENHIKEHGHLPEIPSAKEVEENGVDLGKTDALLLQKIEELTLYIIAQDKRIEQLEKERRSHKK